jgi:hypothetical protein
MSAAQRLVRQLRRHAAGVANLSDDALCNIIGAFTGHAARTVGIHNIQTDIQTPKHKLSTHIRVTVFLVLYNIPRGCFAFIAETYASTTPYYKTVTRQADFICAL